MLKIEIKSPLVTEISGTSKAGKPYFIRKQSAWAHTYDDKGNLNPYPNALRKANRRAHSTPALIAMRASVWL